MSAVWPRIGAAGGILTLLLSFGGFALIGAAGFAVQPGAKLEDVARVAATPVPAQAFIGLWLDTLGSLFFIAFAARVWARLRAVEPTPAWMSAGAFGAALLAVSAGIGDKAAYAAVFFRAGRGLDPGVAASLYDLVGGFFLLFGAFCTFFMLFASAVVVRERALPVWIGWYGLAAGLASTAARISPDLGQIGFPLFAIWLVATSVALLLRHET